MRASAQTMPEVDAADERQLAEDIARAMHHRPLLSRLARVEEAHGGAEASIAQAASQYTPGPPAAELLAIPLEIDPRSLDEVIDDLHDVATPPPSAEWLANARQAHRQAQVRQAIAWATTLGIALAIIGIALLTLHV